MTETVEQLQLVNIVEVVQTQLSKNFTILLKKLNKQQESITEQHSFNHQTHQQYDLKLQILQKQLQQQSDTSQAQIETLMERISVLEEAQISNAKGAEEGTAATKRVSDELFTTQLQFEEKMKVREREFQEIMEQVVQLKKESEATKQQVATKQSRVQFERILQETEILKSKDNHFESQMKLVNHKLEKMELLSQRAERQQAKKDIQIVKEIEERVKKEMRTSGGLNTSNNGNSIVSLSSTTPGIRRDSTNRSQRLSIMACRFNEGGLPSIQQDHKGLLRVSQNQGCQERELDTEQRSGTSLSMPRRSSTIQEIASGRNWNEQVEVVLGRWGDRLKHLEQCIKQTHQNLKVLNKQNSNRHSNPVEGKDHVSDGIRDRVNELKPEMVKLWAKIDTIEDRLSFNERKMEDRLKTVNELAAAIKENNSSRLEEKLKNLQTEIFTSLKQLKNKVENQVGQADFDKHCQSMEEKFKKVHDAIYLKSDKLQVKKALLFLESKIKEIILVISEDEENEKDALLTKKQVKCISCDKDVDKLIGLVSSPKNNWDSMHSKEHPPEVLGRFGMTNFGSLAKKLKKLQSKDLPVLGKRNPNNSFQTS